MVGVLQVQRRDEHGQTERDRGSHHEPTDGRPDPSPRPAIRSVATPSSRFTKRSQLTPRLRLTTCTLLLLTAELLVELAANRINRALVVIREPRPLVPSVASPIGLLVGRSTGCAGISTSATHGRIFLQQSVYAAGEGRASDGGRRGPG
jgi:hypothetical protein